MITAPDGQPPPERVDSRRERHGKCAVAPRLIGWH